MNTRASAANLTQAMKNLSVEWQAARAQWRDAKSAEFEEEFLADLPHHASRAAAVIEELDTLLRKVRSDCE